MTRKSLTTCGLLGALFFSASVLAAMPQPAADTDRALPFERNQGQADPAARYLAHGRDFTLFLTADEAVLQVQARSARPDLTADPASPRPGAQIRSRLLGADAAASIAAEIALPSRSHYLIGKDPAKWQRDVAHYSRVRYSQVYPGIDLVYYGRQQVLEYDFVVAPGADPAQIRLRYSGMQRAELGADGAVQLHTAAGPLSLHRPVIYQDIEGERKTVEGRYQLVATAEHADIGFELGAYDRQHPLIIDPVVVYSTYLGSRRDDGGAAIAVDASGSPYIAGSTRFSGFPSAGPFQSNFGGDYDGFISKLTPDGSALVYSTYLGGSSIDYIQGLALGPDGSVVVTGVTLSTDFPTLNPVQGYAGQIDAFVARLSPEGNALIYSTYLGGALYHDQGEDVAVDASGEATVVGLTWSQDFPVRRAQQPTMGGVIDAFVTRYSADGRLLYATYLGGSEGETLPSVALDANGYAYVTGSTSSPDFPTLNPLQAGPSTAGDPGDAFLVKLARNGTRVFSTYFGGSRTEFAFAVAVDAAGFPYIAGRTASPDFPLRRSLQTLKGSQSGAFPPSDAFVTKFTRNGQAVIYSTLHGGTQADEATSLAVDAEGNAHIAGLTQSSDLPLVGEVQTCSSGFFEGFVAKIGPLGNTLPFSTCLGGQGYDSLSGIAVAPGGDMLVTGSSSGLFPTVNAFQPRHGGKYDATVTRISLAGTSTPDTIEFVKTLYNARESQGVASITLQRTGSGYGRVFVSFLTADGTALAGQDYTAVGGGLSWENGQTGLRRVLVQLTGDELTEGPETVQLTLSGAGGYAQLGTKTAATLRILDPLPEPTPE